MTRKKDQVRRLREWILIEAYRSGKARQGGICAPGQPAGDGSEHYYVGRHDVYQRFFNLPIDAFLNGPASGGSFRRLVKLRLRSAAILCESVRGLLGLGLIQFPQRPVMKKGRNDLHPTFGNLICLTAAGIREAESLLAPACDPEPRNRIDGEWIAPSPLRPSGAVSPSVS
jgi:hypothetical protein